MTNKLSSGEFDETPQLPVFQIVAVGLVGIGLALKTYIVVCFPMILTFQEPKNVFNRIPQVEKYNQEFGLLAKVDLLMVNEYPVFLQPVIMKKNEWE